MLIECVECGGKISSEAKGCPHCGFPIKRMVKPIVSTEQVQVAKEYASKCALECSKTLGSVFATIAKFMLWLCIAGILGTIGRIMWQLLLESGLVGWMVFILLFPAAITMPTLVLARKFIGIAFKNIFSMLCGITCVPTAATIIEPTVDRTQMGPDDLIIALVGMSIAIGWSRYFLKDSDGWISPRWMMVTKRVFFTINMFTAVLFLMTIVMKIKRAGL